MGSDLVGYPESISNGLQFNCEGPEIIFFKKQLDDSTDLCVAFSSNEVSTN